MKDDRQIISDMRTDAWLVLVILEKVLWCLNTGQEDSARALVHEAMRHLNYDG